MVKPSVIVPSLHEIDFLPLSALQHFAYCTRQFALIHLERVWAENRYTAEGQVLHQRTNSGEAEKRGDLNIARGLRMSNRSLAVTGMADIVEFHRDGGGVAVPGLAGQWRPFPVEYKRGRSKADDWDRIQLCAQGMCLEEMLGANINQGAIFYGKSRRRETVDLSRELRDKTRNLCADMHALWRTRRTPSADYSKKCERCSLFQHCRPRNGSARAYLDRLLAA